LETSGVRVALALVLAAFLVFAPIAAGLHSTATCEAL